MDVVLDNGHTVQICTISNTLDYAKAQPRKPMKMPLPPVPGSAAPALPPRRGAPPPPPESPGEEMYDDFEEEQEQEYDDFDVDDTPPPKPSFKPPATPIETDENYDEFEAGAPSGPSVYMISDDTPSAPPPPPALNKRPPLPKPPVHVQEDEYMDADGDEDISAGSLRSNSSSGSGGPPLPPLPGNRKPELPSRVEKPKKTGHTIFSLDPNTLTNMKSKLKGVGFNKKPEKKSEDTSEEKKNIFGKGLKPEKTKLPPKPAVPLKLPSQTSNLKNKFINKFSSKPKDMPPVPPIPTDASQSNESHSDHSDEHSNSSHHEDQIDHSTPQIETFDDSFTEAIYDDATSEPLDPLSSHKWYHGNANREECNRRLNSINSDGAFLVRISTKDRKHPYTLAVMYKSHIHNLKIRLRDDKQFALGEYKANEVKFSSVPEVIEHHETNDVILIGNNTGMVKLKKTPPKS